MIDIKPFKGTRPFKEEAKNLIAPSTDHLNEQHLIDIHEKPLLELFKNFKSCRSIKRNKYFKSCKRSL